MFLVASVILLVASFVMYLRFGHRLWLRILLAGTALFVCVLSVIEIGLGMITGDGINDSVFFHMKTGLSGGDVTQYVGAIVAAVLFLGGVGFAIYRMRYRLLPGSFEQAPLWDSAVIAAALGSVLIHPVTTATTGYVMRFSMSEQHTHGFYTPTASITSEQPKNLVILYLEGFERSYFDETRFPGLVQKLKTLESRAVSFTDVGQTIGAGFTVGGMVASQCGVPLILSGSENSMRVNRFLAGATCLGDVLNEAGYELAYLGGASSEFAGKGAFFKSHGYKRVQGLNDLLPMLDDPSYVAEWGLQDDTLFDIVRGRLDELENRAQPFALSVLTLDTHHPNGHADTNKSCKGVRYRDGTNPMLNSIHCADRMAAELVSGILDGPHGANTVVAVVSDHLALGNTATSTLSEGPRRNLFMLFDPETAKAGPVARKATTLDIGPTLLSALGLGVDRMGFGVDLQGLIPTLPEDLAVGNVWNARLDRHLLGFQSVYTRLWDFPDISTGLYANVEKGEVQFGNSAFRVPALLTFDADLAIDQATLGDIRVEDTLTEAVIDLPEGRRFLWFDACRALSRLTPDESQSPQGAGDDGLCVAYGLRGKYDGLRAFGRSGFISEDELAAWLSDEDIENPTTDQSDRLAEIGKARGDVAIPLKLGNLDTGSRGVVLHSAGFGAGPSFLRKQTRKDTSVGQDWVVPRGITLSGIHADGSVVPLDNLDNCKPGFDPNSKTPWRSLISRNADGFATYAVVVHDTAFCDEMPRGFRDVLRGLPLVKLRSTQMRQPYLAVIEPAGRAYEFLNTDFPKLRVYLNPQSGEPMSYGYFDPAEALPPREADVALAPQPAPSEAVVQDPISNELAAAEPVLAGTGAENGVETTGDPSLADAVLQACIAPPAGSLSSPNRELVKGALVSGEDMESYLGFQSGWWMSEQAGRWAGSHATQVTLILPVGGSDDLVLEFGLSVREGQGRGVAIAYDGAVLHEQPFDRVGQLAVDVSELPRGEPVTLEIRISGDPITCPAVARPGDDRRQLAFFLKTLRLKQASLASTSPVAPVPLVNDPLADMQKIQFDPSDEKLLLMSDILSFQTASAFIGKGGIGDKEGFLLFQASAATSELPSTLKPDIAAELCSAPQSAPLNAENLSALTPVVTDKSLRIDPGLDLRQLGFGAGWWAQEEEGRWMGYDNADIHMVLPKGPRVLKLEAEFAFFADEVLQLEVHHSGQRIELEPTGSNQAFAMDVSNLPRNTPVQLGFVMRADTARCPGAQDTREISAMLKSVQLRAPETIAMPGTIAHGGGRYITTSISNSYNALQDNLNRFDLFEIDLNWTTDGRLVCIHDWKNSFAARFPDAGDPPISHSDFTYHLNATPRRPRNCDLDGLAQWMRKNPGKDVVTDVKASPVEAHTMISELYPDLLHRFIAQAYQPEEISTYRALGFGRVIWTLYRYGDNEMRIREQIERHNPSAVAMPISFARGGLLRALTEPGSVALLVHTVNDPALASCLMASGASGLYSDDLGIADLAKLAPANPDCLVRVSQ